MNHVIIFANIDRIYPLEHLNFLCIVLARGEDFIWQSRKRSFSYFKQYHKLSLQEKYMKLLSKEIFIKRGHFDDRSIIPSFICYVSSCEPVLMQRFGFLDNSDTYDDFGDIFSYDNGRTWTEFIPRIKSFRTERGRVRYCEHNAVYDSRTEMLLAVSSKGEYKQDGFDGAKNTKLSIEINSYEHKTGKWSNLIDTDFGFEQSFTNSFTEPVITSSGKIIFPVLRVQLDDKGKKVHYDKYRLFMYEVMCIIGELDDSGKYSFYPGKACQIDPARSSRGLSEQCLIELKDGRIAMICRGDNGAYPDRNGFKWVSYSEDDGRSWSKPGPLLYTTGKEVLSSSTGSEIFRSIKNSKIYWIGNPAIDEYPNGNWPRSPLAIFEVDEDSFMLKPEKMLIIDKRQGQDGLKTQLSNFRYYQDRETGDINLFLSRWGEKVNDYRIADYYRYQVSLQETGKALS